MEGISAQGLDNPNLNPDKRRSVEHLKEMRDVFTPFVKKFSELFKGEIHSLDLEDINTPEFIPSELYKKLFFSNDYGFIDSGVYYKSFPPRFPRFEDQYKRKSIELDEIMLEHFGDAAMYSLMLQRLLQDGNIKGERDTLEVLEQDKPLLKELFTNFLLHLEHSGLKDFFSNLSDEKVALLISRFGYIAGGNTRNLRMELAEPGTSTMLTDIANYAEIKDAKEVLLGFPVGTKVQERDRDGKFKEQKDIFPLVVCLPVGEYGEDVTQKIFEVMQVMYSKVGSLKEEAKRMVEAHEKMFTQTARGKEVTDSKQIEDFHEKISKHKNDVGYVESIKERIKKAEENYLAGILALEEGIATLAQALALLTAEKVEGFSTGEDLIRAVIEQGIPNKVGYLFSPAVIGPLTLSGKTISHMLSVVDGGRLILNEKLLEFCSKQKEVFQEERLRPDTIQQFPAAGRGCPVAFKGKGIEMSGIEMLAETFLKIFEQPTRN